MHLSQTKRTGDWRMRESRLLKAEFRQGTLDTDKVDPLVLRVLEHTSGNTDPEIQEAVSLYTEYHTVARAVLDDLSCGESLRAVAMTHNLSENIVELLKQLYDDATYVGSEVSKAISRAQELSPGDRKRYLMRRKYGRYADIFTEGSIAAKDIGTKEIRDMVKHALCQSYMIATSADQIELDSNEQKTVIAYNGIMVTLIKLLSELEASNSDSTAILERMAAFTEKIPKGVPKVPAIEEMEGSSESGFRMAPLDEVKE